MKLINFHYLKDKRMGIMGGLTQEKENFTRDSYMTIYISVNVCVVLFIFEIYTLLQMCVFVIL